MQRPQSFLLLPTLAAILLAACAAAPPVTIRIVSAQIGPKILHKAFEPIMRQFERDNPGTLVVWDDSYGDSYQFEGQKAALEGTQPADIFFEWGGDRAARHVAAGRALDLSDIARDIKPQLVPAAESGFSYKGKDYGFAYHIPASLMIWYDPALFARLGAKVPQTWDDFLQLCSTLKTKGIGPLRFGNADGWTAGNFGALFLYRMAGDARASSILGLAPGTRLDDPDFISALGFLAELARRGFVNPDLNSLGYEKSAAGMFDGSVGLYPMGSWYLTELAPLYRKDLSGLDHAFFNLPPLPGGKGDQGSIIGVGNGLMVNAKSKHPALAKKFLRLFYSKYAMELLAAAGLNVTRRDARGALPPEVQAASAFIEAAGSVDSPPDTGYDLQVAAAIYKAIGKTLAGAEPAAALAEAEASVAGLRK